jgi:hypothetical protein
MQSGPESLHAAPVKLDEVSVFLHEITKQKYWCQQRGAVSEESG